MGSSNTPSSSTSSPELHRKRPPPRCYGTVANPTHHSRLVSRQDPTPVRFGSLAEVMSRSRPVGGPPAPAPRVVAPAHEAIVIPDDDDDDDVVCGTCGSGDYGDELLICDRCDSGCHTYCLHTIVAKVPNGPWFCPDCAPPVQPVESFTAEQSKVIDVLRIQEDDDQDGEPTKCSLSKGFPLEQSKVIDVLRIQEDDDQDGEPTKCSLSEGFLVQQSEVIDVSRIQEDDQDGEPVKSKLSKGKGQEAPAPETIVLYDDVVCGTCGSGDYGDELLLCDRCNIGCHTYCLQLIIAKVPNGPWFCPDCAPPVKPLENFPAEQSKVIDFFPAIQEDDQDGEPAKCMLSEGKWQEAPAPEAIVLYNNVVCGTCGSSNHGNELLRCNRCNSSCHTYCLHPIIAKVPNGPWFCPNCTPPVEPPESFPVEQSKIIDFFRIQDFDQDSDPAKSLPENIPNEVTDLYDGVICDTCGSGEHGDELLLCDSCDRGWHTFCLRPIIAKVPNGPWFCPDCGPPVKPLESFPVEQSKLINFFRIQNYDQDGEPAKNVRCQRKRTLVTNKKRRRILPYVPSEDITTRLRQMASLATALTSSRAEFSNELTYMPNMAPRSSNQAKLEKDGGIQVLNKKDKETIELCRTMQQRGQCPPLLVVFDSREGFTLQADANIKDMTFIAEFVGDVDYLEVRENDDSNCMMTLLLTADPSQSLVICPDKRANISRFISGINNHTPDGKKKQNVKCVRYDIDGESHVLLVVCRDIASGEKLYCDYNGKEDAYPTHHFT